MIQRIKKPEIKPKIKEREKSPKEERKKSPKREKPLINNKNVNNNVNNNNIVVNIPQAAPIAPKRKRKPKPKITDTAKEDFQKTLNEFAQGNYPPIDIPDITKIKTTAQLNDITNQMKAIMGKPIQAAIMGGQALPAITGGQAPPAIMGKAPQAAMMGGQAPPAIMDSYPGTRGNAYANIVPTIQPTNIQPALPPPPPQPIRTENENIIFKLFEFFLITIKNEVVEIDNSINYLEGYTFYFTHKNIFDNLNNQQLKAHLISFIDKNFRTSSDLDKRITYDEFLTMFNNYKNSNIIENSSPEQQTQIISISEKLEQQPIEEQQNENHNIISTIETIIKNEIIDEAIKPKLKEIDAADEKLKNILKTDIDALEETTKQSFIKNIKTVAKAIEFKKPGLELLDNTPAEGKYDYNYNDSNPNPNTLEYQTFIAEGNNSQFQELTTFMDQNYNFIKAPAFNIPLSLKIPSKEVINDFLIKLLGKPEYDKRFPDDFQNRDTMALILYDEFIKRFPDYQISRDAYLRAVKETEDELAKSNVPYNFENPVNPDEFKYQLQNKSGRPSEFKTLTDFIDKWYNPNRNPIFKSQSTNIPSQTKIREFLRRMLGNDDYKEANKKWFTTNLGIKTPFTRDELAQELFNGFKYHFPNYFENRKTFLEEPILISPSEEDKKKLKTYEENEDLDQLKLLYKKYYGKDYMFDPNRSEKGQKVFDIVQDFKRGYIVPDPTIGPPTPTEPAVPEPATTEPAAPEPAAPVNEDDDANFDQGTPEPTTEPTAPESAATEPTPTTEKLYEFMNEYYPVKSMDNKNIRVFTPKIQYVGGKNTNLPIVESIKKIIRDYIIPKGGQSYKEKYLSLKDNYQSFKTGKNNKYYADELLKDFIKLYETPTEAAQAECLYSARRSATCYTITDYYRYLDNLLTNDEIQELKDQYIKATGDNFNYIGRSNNYLIEKIKESNYKPTGKDNPKFFDWAEKNKVPTSTTEPTTTEPITLTSENILQKYYKYLDEKSFDFEGGGLLDEYIIATGDKFGGINRSNNYLMQKIKDSNYIPTKEKNRDFFRWYDNNQGIKEPAQEPVIIKSQTNENQVNLAYKITNVSYDDADKPRRIDQLKLLDNYTSRNISVYQDGTTIYFCSTGSRAELSSQAAQDWLQSNIAILMGSPTGTLSSRFTEERKVLDELVMTLHPTIIIFCGHSLGGRLSNELFTYSIESKRNVYQPFSITFNAGSVIHTSFTDKYNNEYLQHRVLQFHANYDPLSATNTIGTVVNVPFTGTYPHSMTNFENVDYSLYKNFISEGLTFTETINPSYVVPESIEASASKPEKETKLMDLIRKMYELEPSKRYNVNTEEYNNAKTYYVENREYFNTIDIEPFFRKYTINEQEFNFYMQIFLNLKRIPISVNPAEKDMGKDLKLMSYINQLWEMNRDNDYDTTETFSKTQEYYNTNREHFDTLNDYGRKEMLIIGYFDRQGTIRPKAERYLFFLNLFDRLSGPAAIRTELGPEPNENVEQPEATNSWQDYEGGNVENPPEYETPYGGYIGAGLGTLVGGITSGGNPVVAGGAAAAGFLAGNTIQNALEGRPSAPQPIAPSGGGRRGTIYVPSTM